MLPEQKKLSREMQCGTCTTYFKFGNYVSEAITQCPRCREWRCMACSFINRPKQRVCHICKTKRGEHNSPLQQDYHTCSLPKDNHTMDPNHSLCTNKSEECYSMDGHESNGWRIVIIGASRHAQHLAGDLILGDRMFSSRSRDNRCRIGFVPYKNKTLNVVNTPSMFDFTLREDKIQREFRRMILLLSPGPHLFLHVVDEDDSEGDENTLDTFVSLLGDDMKKFTMRLSISRESESVVSMDDALSLPDLGDSWRIQLLESIENFVMKNGKAHFRHELFVEPDQLFQHCADGKLKRDEELVQKLRNLEDDLKKMKHKDERDSQKIQDLEAEIRQCRVRLNIQEEQLLQVCRKRLIDDATLDKIFAGLKTVGGHLLTVALSFVFKKFFT